MKKRKTPPKRNSCFKRLSGQYPTNTYIYAKTPGMLMFSSMIFFLSLRTTCFFSEFKLDTNIDCKMTVI